MFAYYSDPSAGRRFYIMRTLAIGDIHGCIEQLDALLDRVAPHPEDNLIFLGDLVDRGPDSAGVLRRVRSLAESHTVQVIKGNHEQMMLEAKQSHDRYAEWIRNGGDATLRSYAGTRATLRDILAADWAFLSGQLVDFVEDETHIFVHANAYPDIAMPEQPAYMLQWERCDRISAHHSGKTIVCGHTPQLSGLPLNLGFAICLDTHAYNNGPLTCLDSKAGTIWQAMPSGRIERSHISEY